MELFKGQSLLEFTERFKTDLVNNGKNFPTLHKVIHQVKILDTRYIFLGIRI